MLKEFGAILQPRRGYGHGLSRRRSDRGIAKDGKQADDQAKDKRKGFEVGYQMFSINGKMLGHAEPIRVKQGERVLFHVLNASAGGDSKPRVAWPRVPSGGARR